MAVHRMMPALRGSPLDAWRTFSRPDSLIKVCSHPLLLKGRHFLGNLERAQPRVGPKQQGQTAQATRHGQDSLQVVFGLARRVLHAGAQGQFEAVAQRAQIGGTRCVAVRALVG